MHIMLQLQIILFTLTISCNCRIDSSFKELLKIVAGERLPDNASFERLESLEPDVEGVADYHVANEGRPNFRRQHDDEIDDFLKNKNLKTSYFCPVPRSAQVNAEQASDENFRWVARVVLSPDLDQPLLCTASAVRRNVFLTAARCLFSLKVGYVSVLYGKYRYFPRAFVLPSKPTRQMFHDAGFIVVDNNAEGHWENIQLTNRTQKGHKDPWYLWRIPGSTNKIVGYVDEPAGINMYLLKNITINTSLCNYMLGKASEYKAYNVPCGYPCTEYQLKMKETVCERYLSGLGHAILDELDQLIGIITWACGQDEPPSKYFLPVGLSIINSHSFIKNLACAEKISSAVPDATGGFKNVC